MKTITLKNEQELLYKKEYKNYTGRVEYSDQFNRAHNFLWTTYLNGKRHSFNDEPAGISGAGRQLWYENGLVHRVGGYASMVINGTCLYYLNNEPRYNANEYWKECLEKYRTPENELRIMAGILSAVYDE